MCGRYAMSMDAGRLQQTINHQYNIPRPEIRESQPEDHSYNVAPTKNAPTLRIDHESDDAPDTPTLEWMSWGLMPFWSKERSTSQQYKTFNARMESIMDGSRMWKSVRGGNFRCVVPVEGYYEWLHKPTGQGKKVDKIPYFIKRKDGRLTFLAGLTSHVKFEGDEHGFSTFTIITGPSPDDMKWLHHRMPIVLEPGTEAWDRWLSNEKWTDDLRKGCLKEFNDAKTHLECYEVSRDVGKVQNDGEYLIAKAKKGGITSFFGNKKEPAEKEVKGESGLEDEEAKGKVSATATGGMTEAIKKKKKDAEPIANSGAKAEASDSTKESKVKVEDPPPKEDKKSSDIDDQKTGTPKRGASESVAERVHREKKPKTM